jgi:hypothetical protein
MKSLLDESACKEILLRLDKIPEDGTGKWGSMSAAQMFHHCQKPLAVALGRQQLKKPGIIMAFLMWAFKASLYNDRPWKHNLPTPREFKVELDFDFQTEKAELKGIIRDFYQEKDKEKWEPHIVFGSFTPHQWGQMQYKHLDHHLRQFGV